MRDDITNKGIKIFLVRKSKKEDPRTGKKKRSKQLISDPPVESPFKVAIKRSKRNKMEDNTMTRRKNNENPFENIKFRIVRGSDVKELDHEEEVEHGEVKEESMFKVRVYVNNKLLGEKEEVAESVVKLYSDIPTTVIDKTPEEIKEEIPVEEEPVEKKPMEEEQLEFFELTPKEINETTGNSDDEEEEEYPDDADDIEEYDGEEEEDDPLDEDYYEDLIPEKVKRKIKSSNDNNRRNNLDLY